MFVRFMVIIRTHWCALRKLEKQSDEKPAQRATGKDQQRPAQGNQPFVNSVEKSAVIHANRQVWIAVSGLAVVVRALSVRYLVADVGGGFQWNAAMLAAVRHGFALVADHGFILS